MGGNSTMAYDRPDNYTKELEGLENKIMLDLSRSVK